MNAIICQQCQHDHAEVEQASLMVPALVGHSQYPARAELPCELAELDAVADTAWGPGWRSRNRLPAADQQRLHASLKAWSGHPALPPATRGTSVSSSEPWLLSCPVTGHLIRPGAGLLEQATRLGQHLVEDHPVELRLLELGVDLHREEALRDGPRRAA